MVNSLTDPKLIIQKPSKLYHFEGMELIHKNQTCEGAFITKEVVILHCHINSLIIRSFSVQSPMTQGTVLNLLAKIFGCP